MALRFHNTLSQRLEEFVPADGKTVRMYTCGPTVYSFVHVGNFRTNSSRRCESVLWKRNAMTR